MKKFNSKLIAPCGMNCEICLAHLREKNKCPGCRIEEANKPITRTRCKIKTCGIFKSGKKKFCCQCNNFPCKNLKNLDKRYKTKYNMSMIENLKEIKSKGMINFLKNQEKKWICKKGVVCIHNREIYPTK